MTSRRLMMQLLPFQSNPVRYDKFDKLNKFNELNIVLFVLMINHKPAIACYLLQYGISSLFHRFSFISLN